MFENPNSSKAAKVWCAICPDILSYPALIISDSGHRLLPIPLGLHLHADTLNHSRIPSNYVIVRIIKTGLGLQKLKWFSWWFVYVGCLDVNICV